MAGLPIANIPMDSNKYRADVTSNQNMFGYNKFTDLLQDLIASDCWAITIDDETIINSFAEQTVQEFILDSIKREALINNVHRSLLVKINRGNARVVGKIYMLGPHGYVFVFEYDPITKIYITYYLKTDEFVE